MQGSTAATRFRALGFIPLGFFLLNLFHHIQESKPDHILWICNLDNLMIALGLLLNAPVLIRIAILWLVPGFPLWLIESYELGALPLSAVCAHVGALIFGFALLPKIRMKRVTWIYATLYALIVQQLSRWFTRSELNINVAFRPYSGWDQTFPHYWMFWLYIFGLTIAFLFLSSVLLSKLFPVHD
ncbi:MAG TPA: hypothetical protein VFG11_04500 [Acidobacteriota bacterium]|nr:hypothetical protein [Acidobacteriota bacterium]